MYSGHDIQDNTELGSCSEEVDVPPVTRREVMKGLKEMQGAKSPGEDQRTPKLMKDGVQIVLEKLASLYTQCIMTGRVAEL